MLLISELWLLLVLQPILCLDYVVMECLGHLTLDWTTRVATRKGFTATLKAFKGEGLFSTQTLFACSPGSSRLL